jgi:hypothetical protein
VVVLFEHGPVHRTFASVGLRCDRNALAHARDCSGWTTTRATQRASASRAVVATQRRTTSVATGLLALDRRRLRVDSGALGTAPRRDDLVAAALLV